MARPSATAYLLKSLNGLGDFTPQWTRLIDADKATLKRWAEEEMDALGITS